jgi:hypothetical protein
VQAVHVVHEYLFEVGAGGVFHGFDLGLLVVPAKHGFLLLSQVRNKDDSGLQKLQAEKEQVQRQTRSWDKSYLFLRVEGDIGSET